MSLGHIVAATAVIAGGWLCFAENRALKISKYTIRSEKLPKAFDGKKIVQISDLHGKNFGEMYNNLINSCEACKPDYIFVTGDLISRNESLDFFDAKLHLMSELAKLCPVYYVWGNHEADAGANGEFLAEKLGKIGIHRLDNRSEYICENGEKIVISGVEFGREYYRNEDSSYKNLKKISTEDMKSRLGKCNDECYNILLAHSPMGFEKYAEWGANVTFSGHCHGGVIRVPFIGGLLSPERIFFPKYTKGLYYKDKAIIVVSAGLGKFRVHNPSELVLCTLEKQYSE